jgi:hypothetical protein
MLDLRASAWWVDPRSEGDEITLEPMRPRTFGKASPVTAYWLRRCDGFQVIGGRRRATVERTLFDDDPLHPVALRVRRGQRGSRLIPIEAIDAVCPTQRILYVRRRPSAASRAFTVVSALGPHGRRVARKTALSLATLWRIGAPRARATTRAGIGAACAGIGAARRQWPVVQRGFVVVAEATVVLALTVQALVVWASIAGARVLRICFLAACRLAPRGARIVGGSFTLARRALR